jgi:hypothetical protein
MSSSLTITEAVRESLSDYRGCFLNPRACVAVDPFGDDLQAMCGACQTTWVAFAKVLQCSVCGRFIGNCCAASLIAKSRRSSLPERRGVLACEPCIANRVSENADRVAGEVKALVCVVEGDADLSCAAWVRTALIEALAVGTAIVLERPLRSDWKESLGDVLRNPCSILPGAPISESLRIFVVVSLAVITRSSSRVFDDLHAFISSVSTPDGERSIHVFVLATRFADEAAAVCFEASRVAFALKHANLHVLFVTTNNSSEVMRLAAMGTMTSMITNAVTPPLAKDVQYVPGPVYRVYFLQHCTRRGGRSHPPIVSSAV